MLHHIVSLRSYISDFIYIYTHIFLFVYITTIYYTLFYKYKVRILVHSRCPSSTIFVSTYSYFCGSACVLMPTYDDIRLHGVRHGICSMQIHLTYRSAKYKNHYIVYYIRCFIAQVGMLRNGWWLL